jgi:hypothetical protein
MAYGLWLITYGLPFRRYNISFFIVLPQPDFSLTYAFKSNYPLAGEAKSPLSLTTPKPQRGRGS